MNTDASVPLDDHQEIWVEAVNAEKQSWALIHSKGLLHPDVKDLYRKTRAIYEKIILNDYQIRELHDVEYSLWKLHYKHIDEFRRKIRQSSANAESTKLAMPQDVVYVQNSNDNHTEGFKSFLSEATECYQDLIVKIRGKYGLPEEPLFHKNGGISSSVEVTKMHKCQFSCHCFLVCLGDLARYKELCEKTDIQNGNWSVAATYYLEAAKIWPDSGNPQNKLALLATYVGDEFLALYHCIRSVAVKEPFPDAWDNLILLLEKNRSSNLHSLSIEAHFDFLKPSERSSMQTKLQPTDGFANCNVFEPSESVCSVEIELWPLIVRTISFFYIKSRLEDFPCTFASTMRELEALMALDDTKLKVALESYEHMDSTRAGPFRALQVVSVLIFVIENLMKRPELKESSNNGNIQQPQLTKLALTSTFICMGRLVDRCLKGNPMNSCPLLSAVLVFVEWLVGMLDKVETCGGDEESTSAMSYFFGSFADFLNQLDDNKVEISYPDRTALWEDFELQGFEPVAHAHMALDFLAHQEYRNSFESGNVYRAHRIIHAATKIANTSNDSRKWILYDKMGRKFYVTGSNKSSDLRESEVVGSSCDLKIKESHQHISRATEECEKLVLVEDQINPCSNGKSVANEEEEVILFKPITRYNSAPLWTFITTNDQMSPEGTGDQMPPSEECLRRASSLLIGQNQVHVDPLTSRSDFTNFRCIKPLKQQEPLPKDSAAYPFSETPVSAGPPSLSAWVLNRGSLTTDRGKGTNEFGKHGSNPVEGTPSVSLAALSINETEDVVIDSGHISASTHYSSPPYLAPAPSAPLLPDDAVWFTGDSSSFPQVKSSAGINEADIFFNASQVGGYSNWTAANGPLAFGPGIPGFVDGYPPLIGMTNTSERFHQYKNDHNLEWANNIMWPVHFNTAGNLGNFHGHDTSRFGLYDRWGNPLASNSMMYLENPPVHPGFPLVYSADEPIREKLFHGYQKPGPYVCGAGTDLRAEQQPLLQYLKEKEWRLQRESQVRGPTYMGN